ncbi:MAG: tRNA (adenosine(37)-N6)-dimethylallyltransferase MiaA [Cyanobacteria bacterium P01_H01_bin.121]
MAGLITICGPTASGKSALALAIAERLKTVILSADSRQVYKGFDIGTAKPTLAEQQQIPHHLIDICIPTQTFTVGDYQDRAKPLIHQFQQQVTTPLANYPLLVGGTGLYIKAITHGLQIPRVPPQPALRSQLETLGQVTCYQLLQAVDVEAATRIHPHDAVRTQRALEVFYATGKPISAQQGERPPDYPILHIGLDCESPARLRERIHTRTQSMFEQGFVAEVEALRSQYGPDLPLLNTLGYAEVSQYLEGTITLVDAQALTAQHTGQFAKRQRTWFRAVPNLQWFDADATNLGNRVWQQIQLFFERLGF